jgi:hypothetical protein
MFAGSTEARMQELRRLCRLFADQMKGFEEQEHDASPAFQPIKFLLTLWSDGISGLLFIRSCAGSGPVPDEDHAALRDAHWKMYSENCTQARHHETQRSAVASAFIAIAGAVIGIITSHKALTPLDLPLTLLLVALGGFGAVFSAKQYERIQLHTRRARGYRDAYDALLPGAPLRSIKQKADDDNSKEFPQLSALRLNKFWIAMNLAISGLGVCLTILARCFPS